MINIQQPFPEIVTQHPSQNYHVLVSDVKMNNGTQPQIITIFDKKEISFEDVKIGVRKGLEFSPQTDTCKSTLYAVNNGKVSGYAFYQESKINHEAQNEI